MTMLRPLMFSCILLALVGLHLHAFADQLASNSRSTSPTREFVAVYDPDQIEIRTADDELVYRVDGIPPVYALRWTRDSKTVAIVHHLAGGSAAMLVHCDGKAWKHFAVDPPGGGHDRIGVVGFETGDTTVRLSFKTKKVHGSSASYSVATFNVDPRTGELLNVHVEEISADKFDALKTVRSR